jgi:hydrogenase large subunit
MSEIIKLNPITRISGFLEIDVTVDDHKVTNAETVGLMFRGFEKMLNGRDPLDAIYFTERICGICSTAHGLASTLALESALGVVPSEQGRYLRDFMHGCEFLQNHLRHFYQYTLPDYVKLPDEYPLFQTAHTDFRLPKEKNDLLVAHYFESLEFSRNAHQMLATFGGKAPHNHGIFVGGITFQANADNITSLKSILLGIRRFIEEKMIPDVAIIAQYYNDYYHIGKGYGNLMTYGCFNNYQELGTLYVDPSTYRDGQITALHKDRISEEIDYSWYTDQVDAYTPLETVPVNDRNKQGAYSWIKSSKYENRSYEVGPLARQWLSGEYQNGISTMDRTIARVLEARKIGEIMDTLLDHFIPGAFTQSQYQIPETAVGAGLTDTTRGSLGHWIKIDGKVISFYQVITPSVWNLSSRSNEGLRGTAEQALMDTYIEDEQNPVELGRIMRSFDPCVSCATHVFYKDSKSKFILVSP